jgi:phytoene synthase
LVTVSSVPLSDAAIHCRDLVRRVNADRALLAELAPPAMRPHLWAIAAFDWEVGRIPDLVSEPMLGAIRRQWWRDAWVEIAADKPRRHPVVEVLAEAHQARPLPMDAVETYLEAREAEQDAPPANLTEMLQRGQAIGGGIAKLEAAVLGRAEGGAGTAWAMIGELRALPLRLQHGRHGLPADRVEALKTGLEQLDPKALDSGFCAIIREVAETAMASLLLSRDMPPLFQGYRRLSLHYAKRLRQAGWNPFTESVNAPTLGRAWSVARVKLGL